MDKPTRIIPEELVDVYNDIDEVIDYLRDMNEDTPCPVCLSAIDMLEHVRMSLTKPCVHTKKGCITCDYEATDRKSALTCVDTKTMSEYLADKSEDEEPAAKSKKRGK